MNLEQALFESRELDTQWIEGGFELIGEKAMNNEVLDVYPRVESDVEVHITIKLKNRQYTVPIEDVSELHINNCLVIGIENLYLDWENRVLDNLGELVNETKVFKDNTEWYEAKYLGEDNNFRIIRLKDIPQHI
jgi:hypothetical protein